MKVTDLKTTEYNTFYSTYISKVSEDINLIDGFIKGEDNILTFFNELPKEKLNFRYAEGKWSIKEVFQHIIDTERVFMHRCFRIARHDKTPLPGFNQNDYIDPSQAKNKSLDTLIEEYKVVRQNSIILLRNLSEKDLKVIGIASDYNMSARAAAFSTIGHETHHISVLRTYYM